MSGDPVWKLCRPSPEHLDAYEDFCRETWDHVHDRYILHDPAQAERWRRTVFEDYRRAEAGIGLPPGIVPSVTLWIMAGERCVGAANIRPVLNRRLRSYGGHAGLCLRPSERGKGRARGVLADLIGFARELGIGELMLACTADNVRSFRLMETLPGSRMESDEVLIDGVMRKIYRCRCKL